MSVLYGSVRSGRGGSYQVYINYTYIEEPTSVTITTDCYVLAKTAITRPLVDYGWHCKLRSSHDSAAGADFSYDATPILAKGESKHIYVQKTTTITRTTTSQHFNVKFYISDTQTFDSNYASIARLDITIPARQTYKITYTAGSDASGAPATEYKSYGYNYKVSTQKCRKTGYTHTGWTGSDGKSYAFGSAYTGNAALTLTAAYIPNQAIISYNANGGTQSSAGASNYPISSTKTTVNYPNTINLIDIGTFGLSRTGYHVNSGSEWINNGTTYNQSTNYSWGGFGSTAANAGAIVTTVYANWILDSFTIAYSLNGGSGTFNSQTKQYGKNITLNSSAPTKTGYTFGGWKSNKTSSIYQTGATFTENTSNGSTITLTAQWTPVKYTVTYNVNGGTGSYNSGTKIYGQTYIIPTTYKPTKTGYNFQGWKCSSNNTVYQAGGTIPANQNQALTLTAQWQIITYTISYNANGGSGTIANQTKNYGSTVSLSNGTGFTRKFYTLNNWKAANGTFYNLGASYSTNSNLILYAQWKLAYTQPQLHVKAYRVADNTSNPPVATDDGTFIRVEVSYKTGKYNGSYRKGQMQIKIGSTLLYTVESSPIDDAWISFAQTFGTSGQYSADNVYNVTVTVTDTDTDNSLLPSTSKTITNTVQIGAAIYPIDLYGDTVNGETNVYMGIMHPYVEGLPLTLTSTRVDGTLAVDNLLHLYRPSSTTENLPAGITFTPIDTTTHKYGDSRIYVYSDHANPSYGNNMVISPRGALFLGSGEAAETHFDQYNSITSENMFITSDDSIYIQSNANTIGNRNGVRLTTDHYFVPCVGDNVVTNKGYIGSANYRWAGMYTGILNASGNISASGDGSISGTLDVYNNLIVHAHTKLKATLDIKATNFGLSGDEYRHVGWWDTNSQQLGDFEFKATYASNTVGWRAYVRNWNSTASTPAYTGWKGIACDVARDGTVTWSISASDKFRQALGLASSATVSCLPLTGGTVTGTTAITANFRVGQFTANTAQSAEYQSHVWGGAGKMYMYSQASTTGSVGMYWYPASGSNGGGIFSINQSGILTLRNGTTITNLNVTQINSINVPSITAATAGTSSATSGMSLSVPYVTYNKLGMITGAGTHTHTITNTVKTLWDGSATSTGGLYMTSSHTANLSANVSAQANGIILAWSAYVDGTSQNYHWIYYFIPKNIHSGQGVSIPLVAPPLSAIGCKYVYINNSSITGNDNNTNSGTSLGITYNNAHWVLRAVYGI